MFVAVLAFAACPRPAAGQSGFEIPTLLGTAFRDHRNHVGQGRIVLSPYRLTANRAMPRWSTAELAELLADTAVRLAVVDEARCSTPQPLMCVLEPGDIALELGIRHIVRDTARVDISTFGRLGNDGMFWSAHHAITLARRQGVWVVIGRRRLGGS